jgi:CDGSH-type Zn-finger protein
VSETGQETLITVRRNGPLFVQGDVVLRDVEGNAIEPPKRPFSLCRCGASQNKPFCDGSHKAVGFCDPAPAT